MGLRTRLALNIMQRSNDRGFTLPELLIVIAIIAIISAMAVPGLLRGRLSANEASAISTVRATSSANMAYQAACGAYAILFNTLSANRFLPEPLSGAVPQKSGYQFTIAAGVGAMPGGSGVGMCVGAQTAFYTTAMPISVASGRRSFSLREPGVIYQDLTGALIPDPPVVAGNVTYLQQ